MSIPRELAKMKQVGATARLGPLQEEGIPWGRRLVKEPPSPTDCVRGDGGVSLLPLHLHLGERTSDI